MKKCWVDSFFFYSDTDTRILVLDSDSKQPLCVSSSVGLIPNFLILNSGLDFQFLIPSSISRFPRNRRYKPILILKEISWSLLFVRSSTFICFEMYAIRF